MDKISVSTFTRLMRASHSVGVAFSCSDNSCFRIILFTFHDSGKLFIWQDMVVCTEKMNHYVPDIFCDSLFTLILPAICSIVVETSTSVLALWASLATMTSPLLVKRLHPWKHFLVKKFMRLLGLHTGSIGYLSKMSLFLILSAQHIFTSVGSKSSVSMICLMLVTELMKI